MKHALLSLALVACAPAVELTVVNYSARVLPAVALTVDSAEVGSGPVRATAGGTPIPVQPGVRDGKPVVRFYLSLKPHETVRVDVEPAAAWPGGPSVAAAAWNARDHSGTVSNGLVTLRFRDGKWDLLLNGSGPESERLVLFAGGYYGWIDNIRRGRVSDTRAFDPAKDDSRDPGPDGAGMISTRTARVVSSSASATPNGDVELQISKTFDGFARTITWTETYTLAAGLPLLKYRMRFENGGADPLYIAYVGRGGWLYARYGPALAAGPRLLADTKTPDLPLGSESVRIAWLSESAWSAVESDSGVGVAISTLHRMPKNIMTGSMVWQFGPAAFSLPLVEHTQGQYPWSVLTGRPAEAGIALLVTKGVPAWPEGKALLGTLDSTGSARPAAPYAIFLGERILQTAGIATTATLAAGPKLGAFTLDFGRHYVLDAPGVEATVRALDGKGESVSVRSGDDLTQVTGWKGVRAFVLEARSGSGGVLRPRPFAPPSLISPAGGAAITDLASYFKWQVEREARGYEIELARDAAFTGAKPVYIKGDTHYMPMDPLAPGTWFWRVRSVSPGVTGEWTIARRLDVSPPRPPAPIVRPVSRLKPLFTIEAGDRSDFRKLVKGIPEDLRPHFAIVVGDKSALKEHLAPARELGLQILLRTHHPSPVDGWAPLAEVESVFREFPNVIGVQGGESLGSWYGGRENARYIQRLVRLAVQYGRIVHEADGCYDENKWQEIFEDPAAARLIRENREHIVFSQKNNIFNKQFMTQSSVVGQFLTGAVANTGAWEDGGWYWAQVGFRKLGEAYGARTGRQHDMPPIFWNLTFLMGLMRGATVFSMDGQGGVFMRGRYDPANPNHPREVLWTSEGDQTPAFVRFVQPLLRAMLKHDLIPSREQVLENVRLAVTFEGAGSVKTLPDDRYREFWALYAGTYGFRPQGSARGEVFEYFPNTGRYHFIPLLPPGSSLPGVRSLPVGSLQDAVAVRKTFDAAYPAWYEGNALVNQAGEVFSVMNTHENSDVTERYSIPLERGILRRVAGSVPVHSYVLGKFEDGGRRLWMQIHGNYPDRIVELSFTCDREPQLQASAGLVSRTWNAESRELKLTLSPAQGAVELTLEITK